ncbi:MAG TPA: BamA/TamA family outer membrane protein [Rhodopila sp.]|jgi:translocation and assembly module TamA|nr:BamA/TamA family outer membrane protein [Rhodopila sp.]
MLAARAVLLPLSATPLALTPLVPTSLVLTPLAATSLTAALAVALTAGGARAADPQPYDVTLTPTGNSALDTALHDSSSLISLRESAPVGAFALTERARQDEQRFRTVLNSFGYYKATVTLTVNGHALDDPNLYAQIDSMPAQPPAAVVARFDLGPQFTLGRVDISGTVPENSRKSLALASGQPALAADVLAAQGRLQGALREDGYPLAQVPVPVATLRLDRNQLDVDFQPDVGPKADIGPIDFSGLKRMNADFIRERLTIHQGQLYQPSAVEAARTDLLSLGVFSTVRAVPGTAVNADGQLPLTFDFTERPRHLVDMGISYSTDLGVGYSVGWHDRNLFGNAEQLNLTAAAQLGGTAVTKPGYNFLAQFIKPDFLRRDQGLEVSLNALKQSLKAYDQTALIERVQINRRLTTFWTVSVGVEGIQERIEQEGVSRTYNLVGVPLTVSYDSTGNPFNPTHGIKASVYVRPTESLGSKNTAFVIMQATGSTYFDLLGNGNTILALRGLVGGIPGVSTFEIPPDQRFYAGGTATVRGYRFQSLGPQFPDGNPTGGTSITAGTVELRQKVWGNFGAVVFLDTGQVTAPGQPFSGSWHAGAGAGARYYTPIGPIRLDVAVPLNKLPGGDSFAVYVGLGQAF